MALLLALGATKYNKKMEKKIKMIITLITQASHTHTTREEIDHNRREESTLVIFSVSIFLVQVFS